MREIEQLILFMILCNHLEQCQQFLVAIQWSVLYEIYKINIEPANLGYCATPYCTILFILYQKAILLLPGLK